MLFTQRPADFAVNPMEVVTSAILCRGRVLVLRRHSNKPHGGKWCLPGGKRDNPNVSIEFEGLRELREETGIRYTEKDIQDHKSWFIRYPEGDFIYDQLVFRPVSQPPVYLHRPEHDICQWVNWGELLILPYIEDLDGVLKHLLT